MARHGKFISFVAISLALVFLLPSCLNITEDVPAINEGETASRKLPEVYIDAEYGKEIKSKTDYSNISIRFALNDIFAEYTNTYTDADGGAAELRCRGNSSYGKEDLQAKNKYSYKLRLESKADLLGMGESRHWYLLANWFDVTHMRNKLAYDLSGELGMTYTESTWVVLYYNGEYRGIYSLVESIRIGEGRVETFDWEEYAEDIAHIYEIDNNVPEHAAEELTAAMKNDLSWLTTQHLTFKYTDPETYTNHTVDIDLTKYFDPDELDFTSGYLIEYDGRLHGEGTKWKTTNNIPVVMDNPASLSTNTEMYSYVKTLIQDFENALYSPTFHNEKGLHYSHYLDVDSLVNFWNIWNLFNNIEFGYLSLYYYIDDGKIVFGPCWDFDNASGNIVTLNEKWEKWDYWVEDRGNKSKGWFSEIMGDPYFVALCQEKWYSIRGEVDNMMASLDVYRDYIGAEALRCYERNGPRTNWYLKNKNGGVSYDFETDFQLLKEWLTNRINWIDKNFSVSHAQIDGSGFTRSEKLFITPTNASITVPENTSSYGAKPDYIIPSSIPDKISFRVLTTHTSASSVKVYLNGDILLGHKPISTSTTAVFDVNKSDLRIGEGELNTLFIVAYKANGEIRSVSSLTLRATK